MHETSNVEVRRKAMRHFETLIDIHMHLIRVNPGHICHEHLEGREWETKHFIGMA